MHPDLAVQRRVLMKSYRLFLEADRTWTLAVQEARSWFPEGRRPAGMLLGNPRSRVRQLYEARDRALQRLLIARAELERSQRRLIEGQRVSVTETILLIAH